MQSSKVNVVKGAFFDNLNWLYKSLILLFISSSSTLNAQPGEVKNAFRHIENEQPSRALKVLNELSVTGKKTPNLQYYI